MISYIESIILHKPEAGCSTEIHVRPEQIYQLDFYVGTANFERFSDDAVFAFDDGAVLRLKEFFSATAAGDFTIELPDGVRVSAKDMAEAFETDLHDFSPCGDSLTDGLNPDVETAAFFYPEPTSAGTECQTDQIACQHSGVLQIEDILTTAHAEVFDSPCAPSAPAFESLIDAPEAAPEWPADFTLRYSQVDGEDQFILAFLGFGLL